jgi:lipopolysaccharide transport system permease protein
MLSLISTIFKYHQLISSLIIREITGRYRQSFLGIGWALLQPLVLMILFTIIRRFISIPSDGLPYPVFCYSALLPWIFFSSSVISASGSIIQHSAIIRKIYFPREILPTVSVTVTFLDYFISSFILIFMMVLYGISIQWTVIFLPMLLIIQTILSLGIGYAASALATFRRDINFGMPFIMQSWMYLSPVIYPLSSVPQKYQSVYLLNPMAGLLEAHRAILLHGQIPDFRYVLFSAGFALLTLFLGHKLFKALEMRFADVV